MKVILDIPDRVIEAYCTQYSYLEHLPNPKDPTSAETIANPQSKLDFVKERLCSTMTTLVRTVETDEAIKSIRDEVAQDVESIVIT